MESYDYEIEHRSNQAMQHVDALSRSFNTVLVIKETTLEENLAIKQAEDHYIADLKMKLEREEDKLFELQNGLIYRKEGERRLFYIPKAMESNIIQASHDKMSHVGNDKTSEIIKRSYWFPKMREKVKTYISNCLKCITYNPSSGKRQGFLHTLDKGDLPFYTMHIDHCEPLEKTKCGNRLISNRGSAFTSAAFKNFMEESNVENVLIAVGVPRANGQIERLNKDIIPMLAKVNENPAKWDEDTPARLLFGINQRGKIEDGLKRFLELGNPDRDLEVTRRNASTNIRKLQMYNTKCYNEKRKIPREFSQGD
ncbi:hypothetical protein Trydic_g4042 [Trypoxylus dichotomus]